MFIKTLQYWEVKGKWRLGTWRLTLNYLNFIPLKVTRLRIYILIGISCILQKPGI